MQNYELLAQLAQTPTSQVFKMLRKTDNKVVVCKKIKFSRMSEKQKQHIVDEVNILSKIKSQHIVKYLDHYIDKATFEIFIITEYCEGGDLETFLSIARKNGVMIPEESIWKIFTQVTLALHEIHAKKDEKIIHRDVKPANIFLDSENNVKLGDFGLAKKISNEANFEMTKLNDAYYLSPEQLQNEVFTEKTDIWSLGCLLYQLTTLNVPFQGSNQLQVAMKIKTGQLEPISSLYSKELTRVIKWCLFQDPADRPTAEELIHIPSIEKLTRIKRLGENINILNYREKELIKKEKELEQRELALKQKEKGVVDKYLTVKPSGARIPFKQLDNLI